MDSSSLGLNQMLSCRSSVALSLGLGFESTGTTQIHSSYLGSSNSQIGYPSKLTLVQIKFISTDLISV